MSVAYPYTEKEILILASLVDPERSAIDAGSSYGDYAKPLSNLVKHVYCFEPITTVRELCQTKLAAQTNVTFYPYALSDREGDAVLRIPLFMRDGQLKALSYLATIDPSNQPVCDDEQRETVQVRRLDDFGFKDIGFLKIDVEGHEDAVLRGSMALLQEQGPNLLIEIEERHKANAIQSITEMLRPLGYQGVFCSWYDKKFIPVEQFNAETHQCSGDVMTSRYSNNFVFTRSAALIDYLASLVLIEQSPAT